MPKLVVYVPADVWRQVTAMHTEPEAKMRAEALHAIRALGGVVEFRKPMPEEMREVAEAALEGVKMPSTGKPKSELDRILGRRFDEDGS